MRHWTETFFGEHFKEFGFDSKDPERTEMEARFIIGALDLKPGDKVLDICCGVGRHAIELAKQGYKVTGVDLTQSYVGSAAEEASKKSLDCEFLIGDMRSLPFENEFDAAYNFFTSWGYYSDEENLIAIRQVYEALKPGGRFLLEVMNRDWIMREFAPVDVQYCDNKELIHYRKFVPTTSVLQAEYIYMENRVILQHDSVDLRIYSLHEIYDMFRSAGIEPIAIWGNELGEEFYFDSSARCVVLGEKK